MQPATYVNLCTDLSVTSLATGLTQTYSITPTNLYGLGLNLAEFVACLRISDITGTGATVKLIWQYSFDGSNWKDGDDVITDKTTKGETVGAFSTNLQLTPFVRVALKIWQATPTVQVTALVSVWGYYKFRV
jgi:hypothetical protein